MANMNEKEYYMMNMDINYMKVILKMVNMKEMGYYIKTMELLNTQENLKKVLNYLLFLKSPSYILFLFT